MSTTLEVGDAKIVLKRGDITEEDTDVIVNAANSGLMGGGGVDGAIHRAGGPEIREECSHIVDRIGKCPTGEAVITTAGRMRARHVIHTVGPVWGGGTRGEEELLASAYRSSMRLAAENGVKTVAFPSISTGAYRFPIDRASRIALKTVADTLEKSPVREVRFVLFSDDDLAAYREAAEELQGKTG